MPQIILRINNEDDEIADGDDICCYILDSSLSDARFAQAAAGGKMVLTQGEKAWEVCQRHNLDGVVVKIDPSRPVKVQIKPLREKLAHKTLGVIIPPRRHEAMLASEVEPEFVAFDLSGGNINIELIDWYNDLFLLPSALDFADAAPDMPSLKSDFVIINAQKSKNSGC